MSQKVHLHESDMAYLRNEVEVACGEKLISPIAACIFDELAMGQSLDLSQIKGLCSACRKAWTGKQGRQYVYGLIRRDEEAA